MFGVAMAKVVAPRPSVVQSRIAAKELYYGERTYVRRGVNEPYLEAVRGDDFVGIQTYGRIRFDFERPLPARDGAEQTMTGDEFYPEGLEATIREAERVARIPVIVTENGLATTDDSRRIAYIERTLSRAPGAQQRSDTRAFLEMIEPMCDEWREAHSSLADQRVRGAAAIARRRSPQSNRGVRHNARRYRRQCMRRSACSHHRSLALRSAHRAR